MRLPVAASSACTQDTSRRGELVQTRPGLRHSPPQRQGRGGLLLVARHDKALQPLLQSLPAAVGDNRPEKRRTQQHRGGKNG